MQTLMRESGETARTPHAPVFGDAFWRQSKRRDHAFRRMYLDENERAAFEELVENLPTLCWIANADGYITWYNRRWHEYCGSTQAQMQGWGWQAVHDPEMLPDVMANWARSIATGAPFEMVFPLRGADGTFRHFLTRVIPVRDAGGAVRRWVGNNVDISRQVEVERALRRTQQELESVNRQLAEREAFLSSVLAASTDCIKVLDLDGGVAFMSEAGRRVLGIDEPEAVVGRSWPEFWTGKGREDAAASVAGARLGRSSSFLGHADMPDGHATWWHVVVSPIPGADGAPESILSVSRDITALRRSEQQRDHYARLIENSADFIGMAWLDGRVFFLNDSGRRLVGLDADARARDVQMADFFPAEQADAIRTEILPAVARHGFWSGERLFRHFGTGELIPVLYTAFPVQDSDGRLIGLGTVTRDDRARKLADERQAVVNGEIAHRLRNTLAMVQSIAAATLRKVVPPEDLSRFEARLQALARSHELLHRESWSASDLAELAHGVLGNLGIFERCRVSGPAVRLGARTAMSTSLLLHELATNALKHGALAVPWGEVSVVWEIVRAPGHAELVLRWREEGGPPVMPPSRRGFGTRLIARGLAGNGGADMRYEAAGLDATFRADLAIAVQ